MDSSWGAYAAVVATDVVAAYAFAKSKERNMTPEELQSEVTKWKDGLAHAQSALLELSYSLADAKLELSDEQEKARLIRLREEGWVKRAYEAEEKVEALQAELANVLAKNALRDNLDAQEKRKKEIPPP